KAYALTLISRAHYDRDEHRQALARGQEALRIWQSLSDSLGEASILFILGVTRNEIGEPDAALNLCSRALELFKASNSLEWEAKCVVVIGYLHSVLGEHRLAISL